jgi:predicted negative regulator of RcsB-dependent stress response
LESYRTEEEQVEALKRWWDENGRSTIFAIVIAVAGAIGWQGWQESRETARENASVLYQQLLQALSSAGDDQAVADPVVIAERIRSEYDGTTYAAFAGLHLARLGVERGALEEAEQLLRAVIAEADTGGDVYHVAQQRLGRVLAARGQTEQALALLQAGQDSGYAANYAVARGDVLLAAGREDEARAAYIAARAAAGDAAVNLDTLDQKLQHLNVSAAPEAAGDVLAADIEG